MEWVISLLSIMIQVASLRCHGHDIDRLTSLHAADVIDRRCRRSIDPRQDLVHVSTVIHRQLLG